MSFINPSSRNPFPRNVGTNASARPDVSRRLLAASEAIGSFQISAPTPLPLEMLQRRTITPSNPQGSRNHRIALCFQRAVHPSRPR